MALIDKTNKELFKLYDDDLVLRLHNDKNLAETRKRLIEFGEFLRGYPPSRELAKGFLARYADYNPFTLARYGQMIKAFMKWYGESLDDLHFKIPKNLPTYTENADIEKLLAAIKDKKSHKKSIKRDRLLVETAWKTGLRRAELAKLKPEDIHKDALIVRMGKGQKDRMVPLSPDLADSLQAFVKEHKPGQSVFGLGTPWISMKIKYYAQKAGLNNMHTHALRHKFATDLLEAGVNIKAVQALLGHINLNTTEKYLSLTDERLYEAINKRDQYKINGQTLLKVSEGISEIQDPAKLVAKSEGYDPSPDLLLKTVVTDLNGLISSVETPHKQQIRETARILLSQINFPFIDDRLRDALTFKMESP